MRHHPASKPGGDTSFILREVESTLIIRPESRKARPDRKWVRWVSNLLLILGIACLAAVAVFWEEARRAQELASEEFARLISSRDQSPAAIIAAPVPGEWLGRLEIPRLNLSAMVREGDDASTLRIAVGHMPGTAWSGRSGNIVLAGHRDTFFRELRDIRKDDIIRLQLLDGSHEYRVTDIKIVDPSRKDVLRDAGQPTLSLITCYPFNYVGPAPKRFVVRALERAADSSVKSRPAVARGDDIQKTEPR